MHSGDSTRYFDAFRTVHHFNRTESESRPGDGIRPTLTVGTVASILLVLQLQNGFLEPRITSQRPSDVYHNKGF